MEPASPAERLRQATLRAIVTFTLAGLILLTIYVWLQTRNYLPARIMGNGTCALTELSVLQGGVVDTRTTPETTCFNGTVSCAVQGNVFADGGCLTLTPVTTAECLWLGNETVCFNAAGQKTTSTPNGQDFLTNGSVLQPSNLPVVGPPVDCGGDKTFWNASFDQYRRLVNCTAFPTVPLTTTTVFSGSGITGLGPNISLVPVGLPNNWTLYCPNGVPVQEGNQFGQTTYIACVNSSGSLIVGNGTTFSAVVHETTLLVTFSNTTNVTNIQYGTVQPIDVTSSPMFAGITINGSAVFNVGSIAGVPPTPTTGMPTINNVAITGLSATSPGFGLTGGFGTQFTPGLGFYPGTGTLSPSMWLQSRNAQDGVLSFGMYPFWFPDPGNFDTPTFNWQTSTASLSGAAWVYSPGTMTAYIGAAQGSANVATTVTAVQSITATLITNNVATTLASTLLVNGIANFGAQLEADAGAVVTGAFVVDGTTLLEETLQVEGVVTLNVPLYATSGGMGISNTFAGGLPIVSVAGSNGGYAHEAATAYARLTQGATLHLSGGSTTLACAAIITRSFDTLTYAFIPDTSQFTIPEFQGGKFTTVYDTSSTPAVDLPTYAFAPGLCTVGQGGFGPGSIPATYMACISVTTSTTFTLTISFTTDYDLFVTGSTYNMPPAFVISAVTQAAWT